MNKLYQEFESYQTRIMAYSMAFALLGWDQDTLAPEGSFEKTGKLMGVLSGESFSLETDPHYREIVEELSHDETLDGFQKELIRKTLKDMKKMEAVPKDVYAYQTELTSRSVHVWEKAKAAADFASFEPVLDEVIEESKKLQGYMNYEGLPLYDSMLDTYEEGFTTEDLDAFFRQLRENIVPLLKECEKKNASIRTDFLRREYPIEKQKEFNRFLAEYIGFDFKRGVIAEYTHPFTTNLHMDDVRITTDYVLNAPESAMFSTVHEGGHAIFEQDRDEKYAFTPAAAISMGLHESQSRLYENMIGRSEAFWEPIWPQLKETFPDQLADVTMDEFVKAINKPQASLIRTESDELTYCLHIMIRYEIEKRIFTEGVPTKELPELWNKMYEEYLGVQVPDDGQGILQDVHWSQASFGYFPTYALGNAVAAQLYHTMDQEIHVDEALRSGHPEKVHEWLRTKVHVYGGLMPLKDLILKVTGEPFDAKYYIEYLKDKFTKLYE